MNAAVVVCLCLEQWEATEGVKQAVNMITGFFRTESSRENSQDQGRSGWRQAWQEAYAWGQARAGGEGTTSGALAWEESGPQKIMSMFMA